MSAHKVALWTFAVSGGFYMIISIALAFRGTYVFHVTDHMKRAGVIKSGTYFFIKLSIWFGAGSCIGLVLFRSMCMPAGFEKPARQWDALESFKHASALKSRRYTMLANSFALVELFSYLSIYWVMASGAFCILLVFLRKGF